MPNVATLAALAPTPAANAQTPAAVPNVAPLASLAPTPAANTQTPAAVPNVAPLASLAPTPAANAPAANATAANTPAANTPAANVPAANAPAAGKQKKQKYIKIGGGLQDKYNELNDSRRDNIICELLKLKNIKLDEMTIDKIKDIESIDNCFNMKTLLKELDKILDTDNFIKAYTAILKSSPGFFNYNSITNDLVAKWKITFGFKKTEYYNNLLNTKIYFYNSNVDTLEDALKNLEKPSTIKISINENNMEALEIKLNNTIIAFQHIIYFILILLYSGTILNNVESSDINALKQLLDKLSGTSSKSELLQTGGGINLTNIDFNKITEKPIDMNILIPYIESKNTVSGEGDITQNINKDTMNKITELNKILIGLYDKVNVMLGITNEKLPPVTTQVASFVEFYDMIKKQQTPTGMIGGAITRPRLDNFSSAIKKCKNSLKPYIINGLILKDLIRKQQSGNFKGNETTALLNIYVELKIQVNAGINSYIKLVPMLFFSVEFPPEIYKDTKCKYSLNFDTKSGEVVYKFIEGQPKEDCNIAGIAQFQPIDFEEKRLPSHGGFFGKDNGTIKIINDSVIGIEKLLDVDSLPELPSNKTINMMFALGASGTGKTTRYFGKKDGREDDKVGIVTYIINKAKNNVNTQNISIAYFVCYGQKDVIDNKDLSFKELAIFFNIGNIIKALSNTIEIADDNKYMPYIMNTKSDLNVSTFTEFYTQLLAKKMNRHSFSELSNFITAGNMKNYPNTTRTDGKNFRDILNEMDIWQTIDSNINIAELFEKLIIEQKKINTVLPTKNNIESSRGHTCVLIKITSKDGTIKYFPLFDMAGTENVSQVKDFFTKGVNVIKMKRLVEKVNKVTIDEGSVYDGIDSAKKVSSLNQIISDSKIQEYIKVLSGGNKTTTHELLADTRYPNIKDSEATVAMLFLEKIVREGYYINHTIGILIFAAMCVGFSITSTAEKEKKIDNFDQIGDDVFAKLAEFTTTPHDGPANDFIGKTMMMLGLTAGKMNWNSILNSSSIWAQILFSFLYWNEETEGSSKKLIEDIKKQPTDIDSKKYLSDICDRNITSKTGIIKLKDIKQYDTLGSELIQLKTLFIPEKNKTRILPKNIVLGSATFSNNMDLSFSFNYTYIFKKENAPDQTIKKELIFKMSELKTVMGQIDFNTEIPSEPTDPVTPKQSKILMISTLLELDFNLAPNNTKIAKLGGIIYPMIDEILTKILVGQISLIENGALNIKLLLGAKFRGALLMFLYHLYTTYNTLLPPSELPKFKTLLTNGNSIIHDGNIFNIKNSSGEDSLTDAINFINQMPKDIDCTNNIEINQMNRIKDSRISAAKMVLMHLMTGQGAKHYMVDETMNLCRILFNSTRIDIK